jgi:ATP-binding cassette subfamily C (CFTR/MRP) protein 1
MIEFISNKEAKTQDGIYLALAFLINSSFQFFSNNHHFNLLNNANIQIRSALTVLIFKKNLKLTFESRSKISSGKIYNLIQTNVDAFKSDFSHIVSLPMTIICSLIFLWHFYGRKFLLILVTLLVSVSSLTLLSIFKRKYIHEKLKVSDSRLKMINEILNGIKV